VAGADAGFGELELEEMRDPFVELVVGLAGLVKGDVLFGLLIGLHDRPPVLEGGFHHGVTEGTERRGEMEPQMNADGRRYEKQTESRDFEPLFSPSAFICVHLRFHIFSFCSPCPP
jgi:hypothetical protein